MPAMTDIQYNELYHGGQTFCCIKQYTQHKSIWLIALFLSFALHAVFLWQQNSLSGATHPKTTSAMTTWLQMEEPLTAKPKIYQHNSMKPKHTQTKAIAPQQNKKLQSKTTVKTKKKETHPKSTLRSQKAMPIPTAQTANPSPIPTTASQQQAQQQKLKQQYLALVMQQVEQQKRYPKAARRRGIEGMVQVSFVIQSDGSIQNIQLQQGANVLQKAAQKAVSKASPFPAPPSSLPLPISCHFNMQFRLQS
jgi:protein TonB